MAFSILAMIIVATIYYHTQTLFAMRQRFPASPAESVAQAAIARMAATPPSGLGMTARSAMKIGASGEAAMALAGAGALYGIGKEFVAEYAHHKQQREMKEKGYTEISAEGVTQHAGTGSASALPSPALSSTPLSSTMTHTVPHLHQHGMFGSPVASPQGSVPSNPYGDPYRLSDPYSKAYASVAGTPQSLPGLQSPLPLAMSPLGMRPGRWQVDPSSSLSPSPEAMKAVASLQSAESANPMRRAYIKVPRFKIPNKPYDLVQWEANTQAIANNMMANASED
jgi:hypothetical protein